MGRIAINGMKNHAFHGCMAEEEVIGTMFITDVIADLEFDEAIAGDDLTKTVDYVMVADIVRDEMAIRSKLVETVADRILKALKNTYPPVFFEVNVTKISPPAKGLIEDVCITVEG